VLQFLHKHLQSMSPIFIRILHYISVVEKFSTNKLNLLPSHKPDVFIFQPYESVFPHTHIKPRITVTCPLQSNVYRMWHNSTNRFIGMTWDQTHFRIGTNIWKCLVWWLNAEPWTRSVWKDELHVALNLKAWCLILLFWIWGTVK